MVEGTKRQLTFWERIGDWLFVQHPHMVLTFAMLGATIWAFAEFRKESRADRDEFIKTVEKLQAEDYKMRTLETQVHSAHRQEDRAFHREVFTKLERLLQQLISKAEKT